MSTSSPTKAAMLSLSLASTRGNRISGATGHRKRRVRCASFRGEGMGASAVLGSSRRWVARRVCGAMGFVHDPLD
jgi:hypothetical protein